MKAKANTNAVIVVPCYNEADSVPHLLDAIDKVRNGLTGHFNLDVLLVNDGSSDNTQQVIVDVEQKYPYVYHRQLSSNAGHQSALRAGLDKAVAYDAVIMMDSDMQHPPVLIPSILEEWQKTGANIVQMVRTDSREEAGFFKFYSSRLYYVIIGKLSGLKLDYGSSDFRLIDKSVAQTLNASIEKDLFLRGYFAWLNVNKVIIQYKPGVRVAGSSKYTLRKMLHLAQESVLQFSEKPLRLAIGLGMLTATLSFLYGIFLTIDHYLGSGNYVSGWTTIVVVVLFCFGINFIILGFIGTYLAHALRLQKGRPEYIIASEKLPPAKEPTK